MPVYIENTSRASDPAPDKSQTMSRYVAACLLIPVFWGLAVGIVYEILAKGRLGAVPTCGDHESDPLLDDSSDVTL
jgi:hypothetical protein